MPITPLDRGNPLPLWAQLEAELRMRLEQGEFDEAFPSDSKLTSSYGVSRHTAREAVRRLNNAGLLKREQGRTTVVSRNVLELSPAASNSLFRSVEAAGLAQSTEVLRKETVQDRFAATQLGLAEDTALFFLERLRGADGSPVAIDRAWLPHEMYAILAGVDWTHSSLYDELARAGCLIPNEGSEDLMSTIPEPTDRILLGLGERDAVFRLERIGKRAGVPIEFRSTVIRGDKYRFVSEWSLGSQNQVELQATRTT